MDDRTIVEHINHLADEEHQLYQQSRTGEGMSSEDHDRLRSIEVALDQCWDLLRQRRARRDAGLDPDAAAVRDAGTVEGYLQ